MIISSIVLLKVNIFKRNLNQRYQTQNIVQKLEIYTEIECW